MKDYNSVEGSLMGGGGPGGFGKTGPWRLESTRCGGGRHGSMASFHLAGFTGLRQLGEHLSFYEPVSLLVKAGLGQVRATT